MEQDYYKIIISPENVKSDLSVVNYKGTPVGVYSAMTEVVSSGPGGTSIMTQLSVPILLRQTAVDAGYYTQFDGAVLQKMLLLILYFPQPQEVHTHIMFIIHQMNFKSF